MKNLWLAAALAVGVALGGWSLPRAEAGHPHVHCNPGYGAGHHGHSHHSGYGGYGTGYRGYNAGYGGYNAGYGMYGVAPRVSIGNVYSGGYAPYYGSPYSSYYGGGYSPYSLGSGLGMGAYTSGYRGLGYSNFGTGLSIGSPYGSPFGGIRIGF